MAKDLDLFSKAFSFILYSGVEIFLVKIKSRSTGLVDFRVSPGGKEGNRLDVTEQVDEKTMFHRVLVEGYAVRCSSLDGRIQGQYKQGHRAVEKAVHYSKSV